MQFAGNGIAMIGLAYYQIGGEKMQEYCSAIKERSARLNHDGSGRMGGMGRILLWLGLAAANVCLVGAVGAVCGANLGIFRGNSEEEVV